MMAQIVNNYLLGGQGLFTCCLRIIYLFGQGLFTYWPSIVYFLVNACLFVGHVLFTS
jgi:hypothetical protein